MTLEGGSTYPCGPAQTQAQTLWIGVLCCWFEEVETELKKLIRAS
jgi:hypothetical protein